MAATRIYKEGVSHWCG